MRFFLIKVIGFMALALLLIFAFSFQKINILKDNIDDDKIKVIYSLENFNTLSKIENKIIFVGGSNLLFGLDKYQLEEKINRPIVSLAHVRNDGVQNMLKIAENVYQKGDIVILCIEYGGDTKGGSGELLDYYLTQNIPELIEYFFKVNLWDKEYVNPNYSVEEEAIRSGVYNSYNQDFYLVDLKNQNYRKQDSYNNQGYKFEYGVNDIKYLKNFILKSKIPIYAIHPPIVAEKMSKEDYIDLNKKANKLPFTYITKQSDYIFDTSKVFDYSYHLNSKGRDLRTKKLVQDIGKFTSSKSNHTHQGSN